MRTCKRRSVGWRPGIMPVSNCFAVSYLSVAIVCCMRRPQSSIYFFHPALARLLRAPVAEIRLPLREIELHGLQILVRYLVQQMRDTVQPGALLVVGIHDVPGRMLAIS